MIAVTALTGSVCAVGAGEPTQALPYDRRDLSEIARNVVRGGTAGVNQSVGEPSLPGRGSEAAPDLDAAAPSEPDESLAITHIAPAPTGGTAPMRPGSPAPTIDARDSKAAGYESNSWRQRRDTDRALSFSSGRLAPAAGLDPALAGHARGLTAEGREHVYGFLLLRVPVDEALEKKLAGLDVELLGPHDDHHKARLPMASLPTIAAMPEVEWVGLSAPWQKLSSELAAIRGLRDQPAVVAPGDSIPIVINLFDRDDDGRFRQQLQAAGATLGRYDADLLSYRAVATGPVVDAIIGFDFVLFVELIGPGHPHLDESAPLVDADLIRPGPVTYGIPRFGGFGVPVGIMDTGFRMGSGGHDDLYFKVGCGRNFTDEVTSAFSDPIGHGTHVLGIIAGTGSADTRFRGVAPSVGLPGGGGIRAAKVFKPTATVPDGVGDPDWAIAAMDWLALPQDECGYPMPWIVNYSGGGHGTNLTGTDDESRRLDLRVWTNRQLYVVAADNKGPNPGTIGKPGVAKNALTVGSVLESGVQQLNLTPGDISNSSSRGPTGDGRMKPNVVAPGHSIMSASATDPHGYRMQVPGTSFAAPHVTGLAATLMEHYPFELDPAMLRAHLMATAIAHDDVTNKSDTYGLGRVSGWRAHWDHTNNDGWNNYFFSGLVSTAGGYAYRDIPVPFGATRLAIAMTWDELPASSGASRAVMWDLDLWADQLDGCAPGACAGYRSVSKIDNVEYIVVNNPPPGTYRLRVFPIAAPLVGLPWGLAATVIRGNTKAEMDAYVEGQSTAAVGQPFPITIHVTNHSYVASAVFADLISPPPGVTPLFITSTRLDGIHMRFTAALGGVTLGNLPPEVSRFATFWFQATTPGAKTFQIRAASENGGQRILTKTVQVSSVTNLVPSAMATAPSAPLLPPGGKFSVTDTVQNTGLSPSPSSTTRYYLSLDAAKSADDTLLAGMHSVPGLDPGASHTATVNVTIPTSAPLGSYFVLVCADDKGVVSESDEADNCIASPGAVATVARPELSVTALETTPSAPGRAPGATFSVRDTVNNAGVLSSGSSRTRYYLSLDATKGAGDILLTGSRAVAGLKPGATSSGTVTVTVPSGTALHAYFLLACADDTDSEAEVDEANNCLATPGPVVTVAKPDLVASAVSDPPATKARGGKFQVTDTVQNAGAGASKASTTRYYLSLDQTKSAGDTLLTGSRNVSALEPTASDSGAVTVTIPLGANSNTYFLLACADYSNAAAESDEANNCKASSATISVTP